jgi:5-formyltetrahydrofolate cyclo-ligase
LKVRRELSSADRSGLAEPMLANLTTVLEKLSISTLGIYWPIQREIDVRPTADALRVSRGIQVGLPVVVEKGAPLEYWAWAMGDPMTRGFWNIPVPKNRNPVAPDVVVAPLVGFQDSYRLGYGGGYFDRTLASRNPRPIAIGFGFEFSRLEGFVAQPHDVPMDVIVTDKAIRYGSRAS